MRINYHPGLTVARKVGAAMSHLTMPEGVADEVSATTYRNGRENGLCFTFWVTGEAVYRGGPEMLCERPRVGHAEKDGRPCEYVRVIVAEYRNSDDIVLYLGEAGERADNDMGLTDRMYDSLVFADCPARAAFRIVEHVTTQAKPKTERIRDGIKALLN